MDRKSVGIAHGGFTSEKEISKKSGTMVFETLSRQCWDVYLIEITKDDWTVTDDDGQSYLMSKGDFSFRKNGTCIRLDVIFNAVHGAPGENGQLAALWELLKIPHTSCDSYTAALTYSKRDCLAVLSRYGIPMATSFALNKGEFYSTLEIVENVGLPCFVKANRAGSSFGVYKAKTSMELPKVIEKALLEDSQLIIESALDGREMSVGAIKWPGKEVAILGITEIVPYSDFFDYGAKYNGQCEEITPARIPALWEDRIREIIVKIYQKLNLSTLTRSDFVVVNGIPHLLEINTVPGFTKESIIPQQVQAQGRKLSDFYDCMLKSAMMVNW